MTDLRREGFTATNIDQDPLVVNALIGLENEITEKTLGMREESAKVQNRKLEKAFSTQSSKSSYQTEKTGALNYYVYYLIWIYAFTAVVFLGFLFAGPKSKKISIYVKLLITVLLFLYPYYITQVEDLIMNFMQFSYNIIYGDVYLHPEY